jgi:ubiquilin
MLQSMLAQNPMAQQMMQSNPQMAAMLENPEFLRHLSDPNTMQQVLK